LTPGAATVFEPSLAVAAAALESLTSSLSESSTEATAVLAVAEEEEGT